MEKIDDEKWTEVPYKSQPKNIPGILYIPPQTFKKPQKFVDKNKSIPVKHYWLGFTDTGTERWFIELDSGHLISNKESHYTHLVKKYFPSDIAHSSI